MPKLVVTAFTEELLPVVQDFDCGSLPYEQEVAEWIKGSQPGTVLQAMRKGTHVWLYSTPDDGIVGYGSLCRSNWSSVPNGRRDMPISLIPSVGVKTQFRGYPPGAEKDARYSRQIIRHLMYEARQYPIEDRLPLLGLFVHPDNGLAHNFYEKLGFADYPQFFTDRETGDRYQGMLLKLSQTEEISLEGERIVIEQQEPERSRPFEDAVRAVANAPPTPEQQAKKAASKARAAERKRRRQAAKDNKQRKQ
jgi:GNAT superfamily N-acetyltransferase